MQKTPRGPLAVRLTALKSAPQTILAGCGASATTGQSFDATFNQCGDGTSLYSPYQLCKSASGKTAVFPANAFHYYNMPINLLFADGHVKSFSSSAPLLDNGATLKSIGGSGTFSLLKR